MSVIIVLNFFRNYFINNVNSYVKTCDSAFAARSFLNKSS